MAFFRGFLLSVFCACISLPAWSAADPACNIIQNFTSKSSADSFANKDIITCHKSGKKGFDFEVTPIEHAIDFNNVEAVRAILQRAPSKASSMVHTNKQTILDYIVQGCAGDKRYRKQEIPREQKRLEIIKLLIENGADVNTVAYDSKATMLDLATYKDRRDGNSENYDWTFCDQIAEVLLEHGAKTYAELNGDASAPGQGNTGTTAATPASTPAQAPSAESEPVSQPVATASAPAQTESESEPEVMPVVPAAESKTTNSVAAKLTNISVSGVVVDGRTDKPIPFLSMILVDSEGKQISYSDGVSSDANGKFERTFKNVPADAKILISKLEYKKQTLTPGLNMKIVMFPSGELDAINVAADRVSCEPEELEPLYAVAGKINRDDGTAVCIPTVCINDYELRDGECVMRMQELDINQEELQAQQDKTREKLQGQIAEIELENDCDDTDRHIKAGEFKDMGREVICVPLECEAGYVISRNGKECTECKRGSHVKSMTSQDNKCVIESCDKDYLIKEDKCVKNCGKGWHPDETNTRCVEGAEEPAPVDPEKIAELQKAYDDAKAKETSTANRLLGAAGIAATGLGGMQLAQGLTEMSVDADTEEDMRRYLETFSCTYGVGGVAKAGDTKVDVNGTNALTKLYTEYTTLADSVKKKKTALGMRPGIESEVRIDAATSGLYDDETRVSGSISGLDYASFARSILYPDGEDAAQWAEHKQGAKTRALVGGGVAAVGVVGGLVGNSLINGKLGEKLKEAKDKKTTISAFKDILTNAGMINVDSLDLSKLDWTALKGIDITKLGNLKGKDAAKLDTSSVDALLHGLNITQ